MITVFGALAALIVLVGILACNHNRNAGDRPAPPIGVSERWLAARHGIAAELAEACEESRGHTMPDAMSGERAR